MNHKAKFLLKVSGGPDSVYLFHDFLRLRKRHRLSFAVVHFNHHLRGKDSDADAQYVKSLCNKYRIPCFIFDLRFTKITSLQQQAREKRYARCKQLMTKHGFSVLVTAHHRDDLIETIIMNAQRGAGISGLAGIRMWQKLELNKKKSALLYRPLIGLSKAEILKSLKKRNLSFRIDESNKSEKYLRNRVRLNELTKLSETERKKIFATALRLQKIDDDIESAAGQLKAQYSQIIPMAVWQKLDEEVQFRFFSQTLKYLGFKEQVERRHFELFKGGAHVKLEYGPVWTMRDDKACYFVHKNEFTRGPLKRFKQKKSVVANLEVMNKSLVITRENISKKLAARVSGQLLADASKIKFPLSLIYPKLNDEFIPYGRGHRVALKKLFQAKRFGIYERLFCPVLIDRTSSIVAVVGVEIADAVKVTTSSFEVLRISPLF